MSGKKSKMGERRTKDRKRRVSQMTRHLGAVFNDEFPHFFAAASCFGSRETDARRDRSENTQKVAPTENVKPLLKPLNVFKHYPALNLCTSLKDTDS